MKAQLDRLNREPRGAPGRRLLMACLPLLTVMFCVGCKPEAKVAGDSTTTVTPPAAINPVGTYSLASVDGKPVPCRVTHDGHTMVVKSGGFLIRADGTCRSQMFLEGRDTGIEVKATYTQAGSKLTMQWQGAGRTVGSVEGDTFTMNNEGMVLAYRKQTQSASEPPQE